MAFSDPYNVFVVGSFAILCPDGYGYVKQPVGELMKGIYLYITLRRSRG